MSEIKFYSEKTGRYYKLVSTSTWPYLEISGIRMHRADKIDPKKDAMLKIRALGRIHGRVLDCCTGLGYTAILAASKESVKEVITIEKDENVIEIAKQNPFSRPLFENPKIKIILADAFQEIGNFEDKYFNFIIHDPPRISIAQELYSLEFYKQLFRVLKDNGRIFHYIGRAGVRQGKDYIKGIMKRLRLAGFTKIKTLDYVQGLIIEK